MSDVTQRTKALPFRQFFASGHVVGAYPTLAPQLATPSGDGVLPIATDGQNTTNFAKFLLYGVGSAGGTFNAKIVGWQVIGTGSNAAWVPITLIDMSCTLSTTTGPSGSTSPLLSTNNCVGTIAVNSSLVEPNYSILPADNGIQLLALDLLGMQFLQLVIGTGTATSGNAAMSGY